MIYANLSQTKKAFITDGETLYQLTGDNVQTVEKPAHELKNHINQVTAAGNTFESIAAAVDFLKTEKETRAKYERERRAANKVEREKFINSLDEFWQDVNNRIGFDVITPFVKKYPGCSFVAYDANFVWCKTTKTAYLLDGFKGRAYLPKSVKNIVRFGAKLD